MQQTTNLVTTETEREREFTVKVAALDIFGSIVSLYGGKRTAKA